MSDSIKYWIQCTIENTGFSRERQFEVSLPQSGRVVGTAFIEYLRNAESKPIQDDEPPYGTSTSGFVQCRLIKKSGDSYLVEFPSSDVFHVPPEALTSRA
ncbi:MAG TPA: hypothetical protein VHV55_27945 [Pirellulales bacterium]|jgi:hypothetical protein|nr:hypothetical protein [Pirellulales bacterium]